MINSSSQLAQQFWEKGKLAHCPVIDFHAHMGEFSGGYLPRESAEGMLKTMDSCNTILTCFCSHGAMCPLIGEDGDMEVVNKYPGRFRAYHAVISPYVDPEGDIDRMEKNKDIFIGFKFHGDSYAVPLSDPRHDPYWEYADKHRLLVLSHTWGGSPYDGADEVEKIVARYKNLVFIAGHSIHGDWKRAAELACKFDNLYLELTAVLKDRGAIDYLVEKVGSKKILFGTDLPWFSTHHGIGAVLSAEMTDEDRKNIFFRNGVGLLGRFSWFTSI